MREPISSTLLPMAEATKEALGSPASLNVIADGGYSNGEQAEACEAQGIVPYVPPKRTANNHGDGKLFDRTEFIYDENTDMFRCPAGAARLMLSVLEYCITRLDGTYAMEDTDSMAIVATEQGGLIPCAGGLFKTEDGEDAVRALSWKQVDEISNPVRDAQSL